MATPKHASVSEKGFKEARLSIKNKDHGSTPFPSQLPSLVSSISFLSIAGQTTTGSWVSSTDSIGHWPITELPVRFSCFRFAMAAVLVLALIMSFSVASSVTNITTDEHALLSLKAPITSRSSSVTHVCNWTGVICNRHRRVAALNLSNMGLLGTIPPSMGNLSFLVSLDLSKNSFSGNIPKEMAHLRRIKEINLEFNDFSGGLP
ncbi:hypothetical protein RJ640_002752, partial [Escallonia rubra]